MRVGIVSVLLLFGAASVSAQQTSAQSRAGPLQRGWLSGGLGQATYAFDNGTAFRASFSYSIGQVVGMVRGTVMLANLEGSDVTETAYLLGVRTAGSKAFLTAAAGLARVHWSNGCEGPCLSGLNSAFTYDLGVHGNMTFAGLGANLFGAFGPTNARFTAVTLSVEVGWFGR